MAPEQDDYTRPPIMRPIQREVDDFSPRKRIDRGDGTMTLAIGTSGITQGAGHHVPITLPNDIPLTESRRGG